MRLFLPVGGESEGLSILRVKFRPDVVERYKDPSGNITLYTSRERARREACLCAAAGREKREIFLVAVEITAPGILADLNHERPVEHVPLAAYRDDSRQAVALSMVAQDMLTREGEFSLQIAPGTEDFYAETYAARPRARTYLDVPAGDFGI